MKRIAAICALLALCVGLAGCGEKMTADETVQEIVLQYGYHPEESAARVEKLQKQLRSLDAARAGEMEEIMALWRECDAMETWDNELPAGLPGDNTMAIVALGFELNDDGTMQEELIGRLETVLHCAEQYPNAVVVCTGGGTAKDNPEVTEAGLMGQWLTEHGLDENRLLVEDQSLTTAQNALFSAELLSREQPQVTSLAIVSSSYHLRWGTLLFRMAYRQGENPMQVIANAGYPTVNETYADTHRFMAGGVLQMLGYDDLCMEVYMDKVVVE